MKMKEKEDYVKGMEGNSIAGVLAQASENEGTNQHQLNSAVHGELRGGFFFLQSPSSAWPVRVGCGWCTILWQYGKAFWEAFQYTLEFKRVCKNNT